LKAVVVWEEYVLSSFNLTAQRQVCRLRQFFALVEIVWMTDMPIAEGWRQTIAQAISLEIL